MTSVYQRPAHRRYTDETNIDVRLTLAVVIYSRVFGLCEIRRYEILPGIDAFNKTIYRFVKAKRQKNWLSLILPLIEI
jgi:hypothetical protein